jgi:hypothetical protein
VQVTARQALAHRMGAQQLDGRTRPVTEVAALDLGVQDTGPDGARWALACRGADLTASTDVSDDLVLAWTLRGAPHYYRRAEVRQVAAATRPFSEADAAKRVFDASRPLRAAGIGVDDALAQVAGVMREVVSRPTVKGDLSSALTERLDEPYLRWCNVCRATHAYEQTFRLAALQGGLELEPDTSPPVVRRVRGWRGPAATVPDHLDVVRAALRLLGPATVKDVAGFLDARLQDVQARWPPDVVPVTVEGTGRWVLDEQREALSTAEPDGELRLLAPFDLFLQARDRELLVPDPARRKALWRTLGRPGAVLRGAEVVGTWRPRARGRTLGLEVDRWTAVAEAPLVAAAERLAAFRGSRFAGWG